MRKTMKILKSTKTKVAKDENSENSLLRTTEVVIVHFNIVINDY